MPTYSYRCRDCDVAFDVQQAFTDDSLTECPRCHGSLRKLFNTVGVVFKGSGFYRTDSRAGGDSGSGVTTSSTAGSDSGSGSSGSSSGATSSSGSPSSSGSTSSSGSSGGSSSTASS